VDRIVELEIGKRIVGLKNVTINEPFFPGHFPHNPVMPGVLIIEAMAQTAAVLAFKTDGSVPDEDSTVYFRLRRQRALQAPRGAGRPARDGSRDRAQDAQHLEVQGGCPRRWRARHRSRIHVCDQAMSIHPTAIVHPGARLAEGVQVGAYSVIGEHVEIGEGTSIGPHVVVEGHTRIGRNNRIFQFCSIGSEPQDKNTPPSPPASRSATATPSASSAASAPAPSRTAA
jgi:hypothetical protein